MSFIPKYIVILGYLIVVDYVAGILLEKSKGNARRYILAISIVSNVGVLFVFKYLNFFAIEIASFGRLIEWNYSPTLLSFILPIGLSFHTFQSLSYVLEVYKKKYKAEKHIGIYALYVLFFPQLVAGPIERPQELLPQLHKNHLVDPSHISEGLRRMLFGFFKKLIIADRLAILVNHIYGNPHDYVGFPLLIATIAFAFEIYCDFSGYSDIAVGAARVMGFTLTENFNFPYSASSVPDFWRRWHISLYNWFRDYVYIPLGGNKKGRVVQIRNIMIVFLVTGLWHGANWTYVVWGLLHGLYMLLATLLKKFGKTVENRMRRFSVVIGTCITFSLVTFAWIFFRARTIEDGIYIARHISTGLGSLLWLLVKGDFRLVNALMFGQGSGLGLPNDQIVIVIGAIVLMELYQWAVRRKILNMLPMWARWSSYAIFTLALINLGPSGQVPFIYFQF